MKRILTTTLAVSTLLALPACSKGGGADAAKLIPDGATAIMGMSPKAVTGSDLYKTYSEKIPDDGVKKATDALSGCNLSMDKLDAVVMGMSMDENAAVVVSGAGIGNPDNATCLLNKMMEESGSDKKAEVTEVDGQKVIEDEEGRVYLVNDNMMAFATKGWQDQLGALIKGEGKPAIENSLKDIYGKADTKAAIWMAGNIPSEAADMAKGMAEKASAVKAAAGKIDLSKGLGISVVAVFADDAGATGAAEELNGMLDQYKGMVPADLKAVADSVKVEASGADLNLSASASMDDIAAAAKMAGM